MANTKHIWKTIVTADDIDCHLADNGQAQANSGILRDLILSNPPSKGSRIYFPGAGTGQFLDYIKLQDLGDFEYLFTDMNIKFLEKLESRLPSGVSYQLLADDVEETKISEDVSAVVIVLLLQHIDWRRALKNILKLKPEFFYIIIQAQDGGADPLLTTKRELKPSIKQFSELAQPELVNLLSLKGFLQAEGFYLAQQLNVKVPDNKIMRGLTFTKGE